MQYQKLAEYGHIASRLLRRKMSGTQWPVSVSFNVTQRCNLKCRYCYVQNNEVDIVEPSLDQILGIVDDLVQRGTLSIRLLGGEPTMRADLPEIIRHIKSKRIFCELVTNGIRLDSQIQQWPELRLLDSISVSLDGDEPLHDFVRGPGTFKKTVAATVAARKAGFPVRIHATFGDKAYTSETRPHLFLAELGKEHGLPLNIGTYCPSPMKDGNLDRLDRQSFRKSRAVYSDLLELKLKGYPIATATHILRKAIGWFDATDKYIIYGEKSVIPKGYHRCVAGILNCFLDTDGCMYSCPIHWKKGISLFEHGIDASYEYMRDQKLKRRCQVCFNVGQWEYSRFFNLTDPRVALNIARNVLRLATRR